MLRVIFDAIAGPWCILDWEDVLRTVARSDRQRQRFAVFIHVAVHNSPDAMFQLDDIEVDDQAHADSGQPQVREQLCYVKVGDLLHALDLDDDAVFHEEVDHVRATYVESLVFETQRHAYMDIQADFDEFLTQAGDIHTLEQAGPTLLMHVDGGPDDLMTHSIDGMHAPRRGKSRSS